MLIGVMVDVVGTTAQLEQEVRLWPGAFLIPHLFCIPSRENLAALL